jgi:HEAT repeat protein
VSPSLASVAAPSGTLCLALLASCAQQSMPAPPPLEPPPLEPVVALARAGLADLEGPWDLAPEGLDPSPDADPPPSDAEAGAAVDGLTEFVGSATGPERELGLADLVALGPRLIAPASSVALSPEHADAQRAAAVDALAELGTSDSAEALFRLMRDAREGWIRARCAWRLGQARREEIVPNLTLRLKYETDAEAVCWLAWALAENGSLAGFEAVANLLDGGVSDALAATIDGHAREAGAPFGLDSPRALAAHWAKGDGFGGDGREAGEPAPSTPRGPAWERAVWSWIDRLDEYQLRGIDEARFVLSHLGPPAADLLSRALDDEVLYHRVHAAQCLRRMGPRASGARESLMRALGRPELAPLALEALGAIGGRESRAVCERRLEPDHALEVRLAAVRALSDLADPAALPALDQCLRSLTSADPEAPALRPALLVAIAALGGREAVLADLAALLETPFVDQAPIRAAIWPWIEGLARGGDDWARARLEERPPLGEDTRPLDAFWARLADDPEFRRRVE